MRSFFIKRHKVTFLLSRFLVTKSAAKVIKERVPLSLKSLPCRLAATGANKVPRPSRYSIVAATGSKRHRADSDSLLCHVRLRRTSRFRFGCASGCEHSEMGFVSAIFCSNTSSAAVNRATFSRRRRLAKRQIIFKVKMYTTFAIQSEKCRLQ